MNRRDIHAHRGRGNSPGLGKRPALPIVDFANGFDVSDRFGASNMVLMTGCTTGGRVGEDTGGIQ